MYLLEPVSLFCSAHCCSLLSSISSPPPRITRAQDSPLLPIFSRPPLLISLNIFDSPSLRLNTYFNGLNFLQSTPCSTFATHLQLMDETKWEKTCDQINMMKNIIQQIKKGRFDGMRKWSNYLNSLWVEGESRKSDSKSKVKTKSTVCPINRCDQLSNRILESIEIE